MLPLLDIAVRNPHQATAHREPEVSAVVLNRPIHCVARQPVPGRECHHLAVLDSAAAGNSRHPERAILTKPKIIDTSARESLLRPLGRGNVTILDDVHAATNETDPETACHRIERQHATVVGMTEAGPWDLLDDLVARYTDQACGQVCQPDIFLVVAGYCRDRSGRHAGDGPEPAVIQISNTRP